MSVPTKKEAHIPINITYVKKKVDIVKPKLSNTDAVKEAARTSTKITAWLGEEMDWTGQRIKISLRWRTMPISLRGRQQMKGKGWWSH